jgi:hypothetical protein
MLSFLERVVSEEGISTDPDKVKTVQDWPRPKTPKQMRGRSWSLLLLQEMSENFAIIAFLLLRPHAPKNLTLV